MPGHTAPDFTNNASDLTDALDDARDCIAEAVGAILAAFAKRIGKPASEQGEAKRRAKALARRIAGEKLKPFYPQL